MARLTFAALVTTGLMLLGQASDQTLTESGKRVSIGVALEGGGALGLAHIGVMKWMEEHRIPTDFVAGTSMGGLVGGMYATGMTPAELEQVVLGIDWDAALGQQIAYRDLIFRRKQDRRDFQNALDFGLKGGFNAPGGLNSGQAITLLFDRHALAYSGVKSFDELPIPFRCVAADLKTGKAHVFENGPLGDALRSTMSLPAVFTPVRSGESLYVDGGLLNNLPVDVVKQMGAGMVIAVYLNAPPGEKGAAVSMFSVMGRSIGLMIAANELRNMELADVLVSVDLKGFTASDYARGPQIIARGYEAAARKAAVLSKFTLSEDVWRSYLERRYARKRKPPVEVAAVQVTGVEGVLKSDLEGVFSKHASKQFNAEDLERDISLVSGVGRFSRFSYHFVEAENKSTLVVNAEEHGYAPPFLNLGVSIDGSDYKNVRFSLNGRLTVLDLGGFRSELRTDVSIGSTWAIGTEYYRPFSSTSKWFYAPRATAMDSPFDLYNRTDRIATYRLVRYVAGLDAGYAINRFSELRAGYEAGHFGSSVEIGQSILPTVSGRMGSTAIRYERDTLDKPVVPRRGQTVRWQARWFDAMPGATKGFPLSELSVSAFKPVSKPASVYLQVFGGSTFGHADTGLPQFFLGGGGRLSAYGLNEIRGNQYYLGRLGYLREIFQLPPLIGTKVYLTSAYEFGKMWGARVDSRLPMDGAVGLVMETIVGPIGIGGSIGDRGHHKWYFQVGRIF